MTISQSKKVSVIVPNYNYGRYIRKRLDSILNQTYPIYELIILDDASTDGSGTMIENEIERIHSRYPDLRLKFVKNEENVGMVIKQWRKGFELASGDYVWIAEADDLSKPSFLAEVMKAFDDPEVVLSYTESAVINGAGLMIVPNLRWSRDKEKSGHYRHNYIKDGKDEIREIMAIRCAIPNVSAVVFKKDKKILEFLDEATKFIQVGDWYFYLRVLENGKISYSHKSLNKFRRHGGSVTRTSQKKVGYLDEISSIHKWVDDKYNLSSEVKKNIVKEQERMKEKYGS